MKRKQNQKKFVTALILAAALLALPACGAEKAPDSAENAALQEKSIDELTDMIGDLQAEEGAIFQKDEALWEVVFSAIQEISVSPQGEWNYADQLLSGIEASAEQFDAEDVKKLQASAEKIREIEQELQPILTRYDELLANGVNPSENAPQTFPAFEGKDLDGNAVDSSLITDHAFTVMNFWFTTCNPCISELEDLERMSHDFAEKGGILIGVNAFTQDGDTQAIAEAKDVLEKKGVTYPNIYFGSDSDAGKFTEQIMTFPSTYVLDRNGNVVGEPILGNVNTEEQTAKLYQLIEEALERDAAN